MTDIVDKKTRSRMMSGIQGKNTRPEMIIRSGLFKKGLRYRLHDNRLPGKPDLVFPRRKVIVLINGCFWHGHHCHLFKWPKTRSEFWKNKIEATMSRDRRNISGYHSLGWRVITVWECSLKGKHRYPESEVIDKVVACINEEYGNYDISGQ